MTGAPGDTPPGVDAGAVRRRLLADREALLAASAASADGREPVGLDQASVGRLSRVDAMQQQATALAAERRRASALARMDAALSRLTPASRGC